jgi:GTPase Era involved in 16S rRNA processing
VTSELGIGTEIKIFLPIAQAPRSFVNEIDATKYSKIIILDDDPGFHEVWYRKLLDFKKKLNHFIQSRKS